LAKAHFQEPIYIHVRNKINNLFKPVSTTTANRAMIVWDAISKLNEWAKNYKFKEKNPLHPKAIQPFFLKFEMARVRDDKFGIDAPDFKPEG